MQDREHPPRDLRPALSFATVAGLEAVAARFAPAWAAVPLVWAAIGTGWVALAYLRNAPAMLGKGSRSSLVLLLPFHAVARGVARLARRAGLSAPPDEVVPGLFVGGWPSRGAPAMAQLDCTAELPRRGDARAYACFPMLDGAAPPPAAWDDAVAQALAWRAASLPVLVHCAYGHGRSVSVVIGVLLAEGRFQHWQEAYAHVRAIRPRAHLTRGQRQHLEAHAPAARANVG
jgi:hypothetical protein